jgi:transposase
MSPIFRPYGYQEAIGDACGLSITLDIGSIFCQAGLDSSTYWYLIRVTLMAPRRTRPNDSKTAALQATGALHPRPEAVQDEAFSQHEFFDPRDRVQVKYEMLRRHRIEGHPVTEVAGTFGVSRQAFYRASASFEAEGLPGLLPRPRGPKRAHKCTDAVLDFVEAWRAEDEAHAGENVGEAVRRRFGVTINPRSIDRALARRKKKRRATPPA